MKTAVVIWREHLNPALKPQQAVAERRPRPLPSGARPSHILAYLSDFAVAENAVPLRRQKTLIDHWVIESRIAGPISYLIDSGRQNHKTEYGHALHRLIGCAQHIDIILVESVSRFSDDPQMAMRAAVMLAQDGVKVHEVGRQSQLHLGRVRSHGEAGCKSALTRIAVPSIALTSST